MQRAVFVWLLASLAVRAGAQAVLILPFENRSRSSTLDWIGESAAEAIAARWSSPDRYVIGREERSAALERLGLPPALEFSHATVIKVAEFTGEIGRAHV